MTWNQVKALPEMGFEIGVVTHGGKLNNQKFLNALVEYCSYIRISIDGPTIESRREIHGVDDFYPMVNGIKNLMALKQSKHTPEIILKLSNLLDYILYQVEKPRVSLREEVLHIKEYIELEKIRFQDTLKVEFNFSEIHEGIQIAPMLLIPFVENAFKHGELTQGYLRIRIDIMVENLMLDFSIKNSVLSKGTEENENGIGLENFRKRLDLNYKDNYTLEKYIKDGWYSAHLRIPDLNKINNG